MSTRLLLATLLVTASWAGVAPYSYAQDAYVVGITGALTSVALSPGPSVGASGAIFGLMAAVAAFLHHHDQLWFQYG